MNEAIFEEACSTTFGTQQEQLIRFIRMCLSACEHQSGEVQLCVPQGLL